MGRGGTGVASPCADGSAIFFNPAGLILPSGKGVVSGGATMIRASGDFTNSSTGEVSSLVEETHPVPAVYVGYGLSDEATIGFGIFAPYGLAIEWPEDAQGRFLGYYSSVKGIYFQPTFGLKAGKRLSFGLGFDITSSSVELKQRVDLADQLVPGGGGITFANLGIAYGTDFANVELAGSDVSLGFHVGAIAHDALFYRPVQHRSGPSAHHEHPPGHFTVISRRRRLRRYLPVRVQGGRVHRSFYRLRGGFGPHHRPAGLSHSGIRHPG